MPTFDKQSDLEFQYSTVTCCIDTTPKEVQLPWPEFVSSLKNPAIRENKDGPALIPAQFSIPIRRDENVQHLTALALDLDCKETPITRKQIEDLLQGYTYVAYTTYSSTPDRLRWRVILFYRRPVSKDQHRKAYEYMQRRFGTALDPACKNPSHCFYMPACPTEMEQHYQWFEGVGVPLDPDAIPIEEQAQAHFFYEEARIAVDDLRVSQDIKQIIREGRPKGERSEVLFGALRAMVKAGHTDGEMTAVLMDPANKLSAKPLELGLAWLMREIERARKKPDISLAQSPEIDQHDPEVVQMKARMAGFPLSLPCADYGNAQRLIKNFGTIIRYCPEAGRWLVWSGTRWEWDMDGALERMAKVTARNIMKEADREQDLRRRGELANWSLHSESIHRVKAMIELAKTEIGIVVPLSKLDANPMLFGVSNGVIDLRIGQPSPNRQGNYITKRGLVDYQPGAQCPKWERFIGEVFDGDREMISYFQRVVGYALTGQTTEQCMFILQGNGSNGKTTLAETIKHLLGDYAQTIPPDALMMQKNQGGPTPDLARLRGARLVLAAESDCENVLSPSFVKRVTGEETISCRELYGKPFEYRPAFKLCLITNHRPNIRDDGDGMWRRLQLIEFKAQFKGEKKNPNLQRELLDELPGILNWAIAGCLEWQANKLAPPGDIISATNQYRKDMDLIGQWIDDRCMQDPQAKETSSTLYCAFEGWCIQETGSCPISKSSFGRKLDGRGYTACKNEKGQRSWRGLKLVQVAALSPEGIFSAG